MIKFRLLLTILVTIASFASAIRLSAAAVEDEMEDIKGRIVAKAQTGKSTETDLASELNELSDLYSMYRTQKGIASAILLMRAQIYDQIIKDKEMAMAIHIQIVTEYPGTTAAYISASTLDALQATQDPNPPPSRQRASSERERPSSSASSRGPGSGQRSASSGSSTQRNRNSGREAGAAAARSGPRPEVGGIFPDFSVQDLDGLPLTLSQFRGQMVLVDFWATSSPECIENMDNVMAAYRRFHGKGFEIIGIGLDRDRAPMKNFIRARTITWPQFFDEGGALARRFGVTAAPASFLIDRQGKVVAVDLKGYALERALQKHLDN